MRLIILHSKKMPDTAVDEWLAFVRGDVGAAGEVVTGRDDFNAFIKQAGSWNTWARSVVERFDAGIVPTSDGSVGRVTAQIVEGFLSYGKPVSMVDARGKATPVQVCQKTSGNMTNGWTLS